VIRYITPLFIFISGDIQQFIYIPATLVVDGALLYRSAVVRSQSAYKLGVPYYAIRRYHVH